MATNGTKRNRLQELHAEYISKGGKDGAPIAANKPLLEAYAKAKVSRLKAEKALESAQLHEQDCIAAIIRNNGKGSMRIDGEKLTPMSRGETLFFKTEGSSEVRELS